MVGKYYVVFNGHRPGIYYVLGKKLNYKSWVIVVHTTRCIKDRMDAEAAFVEYWKLNETEKQEEISQKNSNDIINNYAAQFLH